MSEHSNVMGGSNAARRINCIPSYHLNEELDIGDTSSEFAERGTMLHSAAEYVLDQDAEDHRDREKIYARMLGNTFGTSITLTSELVRDKLRPAVDAVYEIFDEYDVEEFDLEMKLSYGDDIPGAHGTADIVATNISARVVLVLDFKFGDGIIVDPVENEQLAFYAGAAFMDPQADHLIPEGDEPIKVVTGVIQPTPRANRVYELWETDDEWLYKFIDVAAEASQKALVHHTIAVSGDEKKIKKLGPPKQGSHCKFCPSMGGNCRANDALALEALEKPVDVLTAVELGYWRAKADQLTAFAKAVTEHVDRNVRNGSKIPGYKLVAGKPGNRAWVNEDEAEERIKKFRLKVDEMYKPRVLVSPTQFEKAFKSRYDKIADDHVHKPRRPDTVVPDSDPRPSLAEVGKQFAEVLPKNTEDEKSAKTET